MTISSLPRPTCALLVLAMTWMAVAWAAPAEAIPQFARRYEVTCSRCHVLPPKLNDFGEEFLARGYRSPELAPRRGAWPALWVTGRAESRRLADGERETIEPFVNRVEVISGGRLIKPWLSYFVEWRTVSQGTRGDGTLRNRSGRFEDLLVHAQPPGGWELTVGQFRQVGQVDVSRRLSLSEPLVLSSSLPGEGGGDARERSLRAFSPSGRSPSVRFGHSRELAGGWTWTTTAALPVPGEISVPLNDEAEREASHEIDFDLKGVVLESYLRRGVHSVGGHVFYDDSERYLAHGVAASRWRDLWWSAMAGVARSGGSERARWSLEGQYLPSERWGLGARLENQAGDGAEAALVPYLVWHLPAKRYRLTLTAEQRIQEDRHTTLLELGVVF